MSEASPFITVKCLNEYCRACWAVEEVKIKSNTKNDTSLGINQILLKIQI
jgi:hypothetical protein